MAGWIGRSRWGDPLTISWSDHFTTEAQLEISPPPLPCSHFITDSFTHTKAAPEHTDWFNRDKLGKKNGVVLRQTRSEASIFFFKCLLQHSTIDTVPWGSYEYWKVAKSTFMNQNSTQMRDMPLCSDNQANAFSRPCLPSMLDEAECEDECHLLMSSSEMILLQGNAKLSYM